MGFSSGAKTLPQIINDIANEVIASTANWVDGDTSWTTVDTTGNNARRCMRFTGDAQDIWVALECVNTHVRTHSGSSGYYAKGLRVTFSSSWDYVNNTYPAQASDESQNFIGFQAKTNGGVSADLGELLLTHYLWTDSSGFVLMAEPEATANENHQNSFICCMERMASKEYSDGLTNFYCFTDRNLYSGDNNNWPGQRRRDMIRPFAYQDYAGNGTQFWHSGKWHAFKSIGSGKVYFVKPLICNDADEFMPIGQSNLFFKFSAESGLVDGDVVAVQGSTTKYICKALQSPNSTVYIYYAIKYVA